ncbi:MAG: transcriptional regulator, partial [Aeromonadaceae bacterium]|nr:transcriptional regulator [Aeromonadaceae bacterium]
GNRIEGIFTVDRTYVGNPKNETYMVIYTPENKLSETTTILSEAKLMARATAVVDPGLKDPVIPHSAWGLLKLQIEDLSGDSGKDNMYKPAYQDAVDANTPKVDPTPNKLSIAPAAATAAVAAGAATSAVSQTAVAPATTATPVASGSMLAETEQLYNQLIQKAVKDGDIEKAMAFAGEAERAGSRTAKPTLIDAIKHSQK